MIIKLCKQRDTTKRVKHFRVRRFVVPAKNKREAMKIVKEMEERVK